MLATRLHYLFAVHPDWATEHVIARLSPDRSQEAASLWSAYGWSPSVGPDLLRAFKGPFLEILRSEGPEYRKLGNLRSLFMTVCLEAPEELSEQEIRGVVDALPESGLKTVLRSLKRRLTGEAAERERIWREKVHPWLGEYWPQAAVRNTAGTSEAILELLAQCGAAFAQAAHWSLEYLRPLEASKVGASIVSMRTVMPSSIRSRCFAYLTGWWMLMSCWFTRGITFARFLMRWSEQMPGWLAILDIRGCTGLPHSDGSVDRARVSTPPVANELKRSSRTLTAFCKRTATPVATV